MTMTANDIAQAHGWLCVHSIRAGARGYAGEIIAIMLGHTQHGAEDGFMLNADDPGASLIDEGSAAHSAALEYIAAQPAAHGTRFALHHGEETRVVQIDHEA